MKSWREVPHLFTNKKFKCLCDQEGDEIWIITGIELGLSENSIYISMKDEYGYHVETPLDSIILIARKIEDMTDEELAKSEKLWHDVVYYYDGDRSISAKQAIEMISESDFQTAMYLLSIGIYPFDQSHFESGEVLDIKEIEK